MTVYNNLMSKIADQGLLFNVEAHELQTLDGRAIPNKRALINSSNGRVMSVVSDSYKVVTNEEIFSSFCNALSHNASIDCTDATVEVKQTATGSRAMVNFNFPAHEIKIAGDKSPTILQISALNSFDGSTRYITKAGGLRMKCMNGQIVGSIVGAYSSTHTRNLDVGAGAETICRMFEDFNKAKDYWAYMMHQEVFPADVEKVLIKFLNIKNFDASKTNARMAHCLGLWDRYRKELGSNAYALYNVLTDYVSHPIRDAKNPTVALVKQQARLDKVMRVAKPFKMSDIRAAA